MAGGKGYFDSSNVSPYSHYGDTQRAAQAAKAKANSALPMGAPPINSPVAVYAKGLAASAGGYARPNLIERLILRLLLLAVALVPVMAFLGAKYPQTEAYVEVYFMRHVLGQRWYGCTWSTHDVRYYCTVDQNI